MGFNGRTGGPASALNTIEHRTETRKVLVLLSSAVLTEAMSSLIKASGYECCQKNMRAAEPDLIIADSATLQAGVVRPYIQARVLLLETEPRSELTARTVLVQRVQGIISCSTDLQGFRLALSAVIEGRVWVEDQSLKAFLFDAGLVSKRGKIMTFTPQEKRIIACVCRGFTNKEIATKLGISTHTAKSHLRNIIRKSGAVNRSHLASMVSNNYLPVGNQERE